MRIILFTNTDWSVYNFRLPLALKLQEEGHSVVMMSPEGKFVPKIKANGFRHIPVELSRTGMNPIREARTIVRLKKILDRERPDVLHSFTPKGVLYGSTAGRLSGIKLRVNSITGLGYLFESDKQGIDKKILRRIILGWYKTALSDTQVIFQNKEDFAFLNERKILQNVDSHLVKSSGVDLRKFELADQPAGIPVIGLAARMVKAKGVEVFIKAARILKEDREIHARFVLAGDVDEAREDALSKSELKKWQDKGVIEWWGHQHDMPAFYKKVNIVCLPSFGKEGIPRTLIEAAASGRPIVTTDNTGCRDAVIEGETGHIVPVKDAVALAAKLEQLIKNETMREEMGKRGRKFAEENFSLDKIGEQTEHIYRTSNVLRYSKMAMNADVE